MRRSFLTSFCAVALISAGQSLASPLAVQAKKLASETANKAKAAPGANNTLSASAKMHISRRQPRCEGEAVLPLFMHIALRPELMDPRYLNIILGRPQQAGNTGLYENHIWRALQQGRANYTLQAENHPIATECNASFSAHFQHSGLKRQDIIRELGQPARHYYDSNGHPTDEYHLSANTTLTITEPTNTFEVSQFTVTYTGPHISGPSSDDYAAAMTFRLDKAKRQLAWGNAPECARILREHLQDNPQDAAGHLLLAQTLHRMCDLNGSIDEYRTSYDLAKRQNLPQIEGEAVGGLAKIGITADSQARQLAGRQQQSVY